MRDREVRFSPLVSILIVNWNGRAHIEACLRSCLNLRYSNREIIVVDNNSSDGSPEIVKNQFPKVQLIELEQNLGFASACNAGIDRARGEYVAILSGDMIVDSMWLSYLLEAMEDTEEPCGLKKGIAGGVNYFSEPGDVVCAGAGIMDLVTGSSWHLDAFRGSMRYRTDFDYLPGGAILIRREIFDRIGLLDREYFLYGEDVDFCMQALRAGYKLEIVPEAKAWHLSTDRRISLRSYYYLKCSRIRVYLKNFPTRFLFSAISFQVLVRPLFEVVWFRQHPACLLLSMSALRMNLSKLRETLVARRKVQALGKCKARPRVKELITVALNRLSNKRYYRP